MGTTIDKATAANAEFRASEIAARLDDALAFGPKYRGELLREVRKEVDESVTDEELETARVEIGSTLGSSMLWPPS